MVGCSICFHFILELLKFVLLITIIASLCWIIIWIHLFFLWTYTSINRFLNLLWSTLLKRIKRFSLCEFSCLVEWIIMCLYLCSSTLSYLGHWPKASSANIAITLYLGCFLYITIITASLLCWSLLFPAIIRPIWKNCIVWSICLSTHVCILSQIAWFSRWRNYFFNVIFLHHLIFFFNLIRINLSHIILFYCLLLLTSMVIFVINILI